MGVFVIILTIAYMINFLLSETKSNDKEININIKYS